MKTTALREYMRGHVRESIIILVMGVLSLYVLFVLKMPFWQRALVVGILIFGCYEALAKMHGKKSAMEGLQKGIQQAQAGMQMPDLSQSMGGFGPFQGNQKRRSKK